MRAAIVQEQRNIEKSFGRKRKSEEKENERELTKKR